MTPSGYAPAAQCEKHHQDLYFGDDNKPGLTTRVLVVENTLADLKFYARWLILLVGGLFATEVAKLVIHR